MRQLRGGNSSRHAWHNLEGDAGVRERERFLRATTEHERVAPLQPDDALPLLGRADHQLVDRLLRDAVAPCPLAYAEALGPRGATQRLDVYQRVVQDEVGLF